MLGAGGKILEIPNPQIKDVINKLWEEKQMNTLKEQIEFWKDGIKNEDPKVQGVAAVRSSYIIFFNYKTVLLLISFYFIYSEMLASFI